jgi:hypothetical protein
MGHPSPGGIAAGLTAVILWFGAHMTQDWPLLENIARVATIAAAAVSLILMLKHKRVK